MGIKLFKSAILLFVVFSCSKPSSFPDVFRYNESAGILTLDPAFAKDLPHIWACNQLYNSLVEFDSAMQIKPSLAKRWEVSDDGLRYTFFLRTDVFFHGHPIFNGRKRRLVAQDFVFSFNRLVDPALASPGRWIFNHLARQGDSLDVKALNDSVLTLRLEQPFPGFIGLLAMAYASALPKEVVFSEGSRFRSAPIGTGPFRFQYWDEGIRLVLRRNPDYFETENGRQLPLLEAVSISFLTDKQTAFMEFAKGNLDFMSGIDARYKDELLSRSGKLKKKYENKIRLIRQPFLNTEYLGFYIDKNAMPSMSPERFLALRKAVSLGIDREKMLKYLRNNIGTPGYGGIIPKGLPGYDTAQNIGYSYRPEEAQQIIRYNNLAGTSFTISVTADYADLVKFIQSQLNQLGLDVKMEVLPTATLREMRAQGKLQVFRSSWVADYPDAENYLSLFYGPNKSPAGPNYTHYENAVFDKELLAAARMSNVSERSVVYRRLDSLMMTQAPVTVLYYDEVLRFVSLEVRGFTGNPSNQLDLKRVYKTPL